MSTTTGGSRLERVHNKYVTKLLAGEMHAVDRITRAYRSAWRDLEPRLERVTEQLLQEIDPLDPDLAFKVAQSERWRRTQALIAAEVQKVAPVVADEIRNAQRFGALSGRDGAIEMIEGVYGDLGRQQLELRRLPTDDIMHMVGNLSDGSPLRDLTNSLGSQAGKDVGQKLVAGMALGLNPQQVAREMRHAFNGNRARALNVARTEMMRAHRLSTLDHFNANKHAVKQWRWQATLDNNTCMACVVMHGTLHPLNKMMGTHPGCRCRMSPVPPNSRFKAVRGETWFEKLDEPDQAKLMGPQYLQAWKDGSFTLKQMVDSYNDKSWGPQRRVKPLWKLVGKGKPVKTFKPPSAVEQYLKFEHWDTVSIERKIKEYAGRVSESVKRATFSGVSYYKGSGYTSVNSLLRGKLRGREMSFAKEAVDDMDTAFARSGITLDEPTVLYRGTSVRELALAVNRGDNVVGLNYGDKGYMSTSLQPRVAESFARGAANRVGQENVAMLEIRAPRGQRVLPVEAWSDMYEAELILPRDTKFRIVEQGSWLPVSRGNNPVAKIVLEPIG